MPSPPFQQPQADLYIPNGEKYERALRRTTHLCIATHADDIEFIAYHGIAACFNREDQSFSGVVLTDGVGSARAGPYANFSDAALREARAREQRAAAQLGQYAAVAQLAWPSSQVKAGLNETVVNELGWILEQMRPETLYLHNPFDRHPTHLAVLQHCLEALRRDAPRHLPAQIYGCEGWRDLDWLPRSARIELDVSERPHLANALNGVFDSQIAGGKRYDRAIRGRRQANATLAQSHSTDAHEAVTLAVDLKPLLEPPAVTLEAFTAGYLDAFREEVLDGLRALEAPSQSSTRPSEAAD
ncbi:MAG: PIG-L deacetylase family protein [Opitutales bacterium]